ncbi:MAG TPA: CBS domain-containing protein [Vicinamibacterales bacterium]|nr:CBS domain-containing protein [Vicinamibacterales bacterium]
MRIAEIMKPAVQTATEDEPLAVVAERMRAKRIHHLVVTRDGALVGVLSARDIGPGGVPAGTARTVGDAMTEPVVTVTSDTPLRRAANVMRGHIIGCLPVADDGKLVGIVTISDLLTLIGKGQERPITRGKRWSLKNRGLRPHRKPPGLVR